MTGLLTNVTNVTIDQINNLANFTTPEEFFIKVTHIVYNGWLYFVLLSLLTLSVILFVLSMQTKLKKLNS